MSSSLSPSSSSRAPLAVVTGAGSGIGFALTQALLLRGTEVVAIDRDVSALASLDARIHARVLDVRDASAMAQIANAFAHRPVTHVFANAGIGGMPGDVLSLDDAAWQWAWEVNVIAAMRTLRFWWPNLVAGGGKAVATVSSAAVQSFPGAGPYRATKAALLAALEGLWYESAGSGVGVHALCPGMVRSEIVNLPRYAEFAPLAGDRPPRANPFSEYIKVAMASAEPAAMFAERVLDGLLAGAPFYWFTHPETNAWTEARQRAISDGRKPFTDFTVPA